MREAAVLSFACPFFLAACAGEDPSATEFAQAGSEPLAMTFVDIARAAGVDFVHTNGASGQRFLPEITVGGAGWIDYDGDGVLDLYLVNGNEHPDTGERGGAERAAASNRLYRNLGGGRFADVTEEAGVGDTGYGSGLAVGDYDNDGRADLYVANFGPNLLYHNAGGGRFREATKEAGVECSEWSASAAFVDVDADGLLDLYVANYLAYDPSRICKTRGIPTYCSPKEFPGAPDRLYRNRGDGTFEDVSAAAGVAVAGPDAGKSLAVVALDYDGDGDQDIYVACDQVPNLLFRNDGKGRFEEVGLLADVAYSAEGEAQAGMGVDAGDIDLDGLPDIVVTNFADERYAHYRNQGGGFFRDVSASSGIGGPTLRMLGFGVVLADFDLDSDLDVYFGNGHVLDNVAELREGHAFAQRDQLLENLDGEELREVSSRAGEWFARAAVSRAVASADFDEDGDEDLVVLCNGGPVALLRNETLGGGARAPGAGGAGPHWIAFRLQGTASNRDGYGAKVTVVSRRGETEATRVFECRSARSYASACDSRVRVGLGRGAVEVLRVEVRWPSGRHQVVERPAIDRVHRLVEPGEPGAAMGDGEGGDG